MPKIVRMFGKKKAAAIGLLVHMFRPIVTMFLGTGMSRNIIILAVVMTFLGNMISNFALLAMIPDCTDYTEYKYGTNCAALINSAMTFLQKFGQAFSTFIVGLVLSGAGYAADAAISGQVVDAHYGKHHVYPHDHHGGYPGVPVFLSDYRSLRA